MPDTEQPELGIERLKALVEAYGGDVERFPQRERAAARELLARSESARRLLEAARAFDDVLEQARLDVSPALLERLSSIPRRHAQQVSVVRLLPFRSARQTWLAAAAAVLLGLLGGEYASDELASSDDVASADISALTFADDLFGDLTVQEGDVP